VNLGGNASTNVTAVNPAQPQPQPPHQNFSQSIVLTEPTPQPAAQQSAISVNPSLGNRRVTPANPNPSANPLATNRVDNRGSLMLESRDATQQNAVIHRSYIKK
jgi:hypothetical protein